MQLRVNNYLFHIYSGFVYRYDHAKAIRDGKTLKKKLSSKNLAKQEVIDLKELTKRNKNKDVRFLFFQV